MVLSKAPEPAIDLQGMASRRTAMGGALGMGLLSSNIDQLLTILSMKDLPTGEYVKAGLIGLSLFLQVSSSCFKMQHAIHLASYKKIWGPSLI